MSSSMKISYTALVACIAVLLAGCGSEGDRSSVAADCKPQWRVEVPTKGVLRVAAIQYPPYSSVKGRSAEGIDGEIIAGFAKATCLDIEAQETTFAAAVSSITSHRADVAMGDLYRTKARSEEVALSDPVYLDQLGIVSKAGYDSISALENKKVATVQGYYFVADVQAAFGDKVKLFPDNAKMYQDLFAGRSDAGLDSYPAAVEYLKSTGKSADYKVQVPPVDDRIPATGDQAAQSAMAFDRDAKGLGKALNAYLAQIRSNGRLAEILQAHNIPASAADVGAARLF